MNKNYSVNLNAARMLKQSDLFISDFLKQPQKSFFRLAEPRRYLVRKGKEIFDINVAMFRVRETILSTFSVFCGSRKPPLELVARDRTRAKARNMNASEITLRHACVWWPLVIAFDSQAEIRKRRLIARVSGAFESMSGKFVSPVTRENDRAGER